MQIALPLSLLAAMFAAAVYGLAATRNERLHRAHPAAAHELPINSGP